jgi:GT2 family glycosyltransferase
MGSTERDWPLVSVLVLSYNRRTDLDYTLQRVLEQEYPRYEVIVIDNASQDGSAEMVRHKFPAVTVIRRPDNIGIAGWNEGAKAAKGEYLLFLDDDSHPDPHMLSSAIPQCDHTHIFALDIHSSQSEHSSSNGHDLIPTFIGCGVIIPKDLFLHMNGFEPILFIYGHEEEFSMRALHAGYEIRQLDGMIVHHRCSENQRLKDKNGSIDHRRIFYKNRNSIILLLLHFPLRVAILRIIRLCAGRILFSLAHHCFLAVMRSISDGTVTSIRNWHKRLVLKKDIQRRYGYGKGIGSFFAGGDVGFKRPRWI